MEKKIIIGLIGEKGSGKGTFVDLLSKIINKNNIVHLKSSMILGDSLDLWNIKKTRENLQKLAIVMDENFGKGTLTNAIYERIKNDKKNIVIYDGIRWQTDVEMIRSFHKNILIYITANPKVRYERLKERKEKIGEENLTFEQFMKEEKAYTEIFISRIGKTADFKIENNYSIEKFKDKVKEFSERYLKGVSL